MLGCVDVGMCLQYQSMFEYAAAIHKRVPEVVVSPATTPATVAACISPRFLSVWCLFITPCRLLQQAAGTGARLCCIVL